MAIKPLLHEICTLSLMQELFVMKPILYFVAISVALITPTMWANNLVSDEATLIDAIAKANSNDSNHLIIFEHSAHISLTAPIIYNGTQPLTLLGNNAIIDGSLSASLE